LLDLEDADAVGAVPIFRERLGGGPPSMPRHEDRAMPTIEIVAAAFDHGFAGRRGDVDCHVAF
jgi:hypothetical protein